MPANTASRLLDPLGCSTAPYPSIFGGSWHGCTWSKPLMPPIRPDRAVEAEVGQGPAGDVLAALLDVVAHAAEQQGIGAVPDDALQGEHCVAAQGEVLGADGEQGVTVPVLAPPGHGALQDVGAVVDALQGDVDREGPGTIILHVRRRERIVRAAVKAAGLVDTLKGPGPFTVFAPTDEAFAKLPAGTVESLLKEDIYTIGRDQRMISN